MSVLLQLKTSEPQLPLGSRLPYEFYLHDTLVSSDLVVIEESGQDRTKVTIPSMNVHAIIKQPFEEFKNDLVVAISSETPLIDRRELCLTTAESEAEYKAREVKTAAEEAAKTTETKKSKGPLSRVFGR